MPEIQLISANLYGNDWLGKAALNNNSNYQIAAVAGIAKKEENIPGYPKQTKEDKKDIKGTSKNKSEVSYTATGKKITSEQQKAVDDLKKIDQKVKAHEQAHISAGGGLVRGGASYTYQIGPDGNQYAVGGEVKIDTSADSSNLQSTIQKMEQVKRAALAPADPSSQDRSVASSADNTIAIARQEKATTASKTSGSKESVLKSNKLDVYKKTVQSSESSGNKNNFLIPDISTGALKGKFA